MGSTNPTALNISLESHLIDTLQCLPQILPPALAEELALYLSDTPSKTIPYSILQSISQWSRTSSGVAVLRSQSPPLDPQTYSMIALLAGSTTSPERKFADYVPPKDPEVVQTEKMKERKTITALLNALLSIVGSGLAAWWAADKTGWKNEWRVLLSLFVAIVVAISEGFLYIIWQSRRSASKALPGKHRAIAAAKHKKDDGDPGDGPIETADVPEQEAINALRQRR